MKEKIQQAFPNVTMYFDESLSRYTYTKTGGPADILIFPSNRKEAQNILTWLNQKDIPVTILGNASNVIIKDGGIRGAVVMLNQMTEITIEDSRLTVDAGVKLIDASEKARDASLTGLEFACGIPGSVGGAVYMNAGAYGGEVSDVLVSVDVIHPTGEIETINAPDFDFSYRHSAFQATDDLIIRATFQLQPGNQADIIAKMDELTVARESKQPLEYPSCGSVFKRPVGHFTGQLIQEAGLQGHRIGGVEVSTKHAGFMVNVDHGTASDYIQLIRFVQGEIKRINQVDLETEVRIIGEDPLATNE